MILDTNALSAFADGEPAVVEKVAAAPAVAISSIVLGEYRYGIAQSRNRDEYENWLDGLLGSVPVLGVSTETALHYAEIRLELKRSGRPLPANDLWIAAQSREHSRDLLSRDRHFDYVRRLKRIDW